MPTTLATNQTTANPAAPVSADMQLAYEIAGVEDPRDHAEVQMATWLTLPGYVEAFEAMWRRKSDRVLFDDVEIARRNLAEASGSLGPDGIRESRELAEAESALEDALDTLKNTLMQRKIQANVSAVLAGRPAWSPDSRARIAA